MFCDKCRKEYVESSEDVVSSHQCQRPSAKLKNVWLNVRRDDAEIRIDWGNDRHQAILIERPDDPECVKNAFFEAAMLIGREIHNGKL